MPDSREGLVARATEVLRRRLPDMAYPEDTAADIVDELLRDYLWQHVKTGGEYREVCEAELQVSSRPVQEGDVLQVYQNAEGRCWARRLEEFRDGRFVPVDGE